MRMHLINENAACSAKRAILLVVLITASLIPCSIANAATDEADLTNKLPAVMQKLIVASEGGGSITSNQFNDMVTVSVSPEALIVAKQYIEQTSNSKSFFMLYYIKRRYPETFKTIDHVVIAKILVSELEKVVVMDDWGNADGMDEEVARDLISLGKPALPLLIPLLANHRRATLSGSDSATQSIGSRRCDYAFRYISLILGRKAIFRPGWVERNADIEQLRTELQTDAKKDDSIPSKVDK